MNREKGAAGFPPSPPAAFSHVHRRRPCVGTIWADAAAIFSLDCVGVVRSAISAQATHAKVNQSREPLSRIARAICLT